MDKPTFDEIMTRRGAGGETLQKAFRAPPSYNAEERTARFVMSTEDVDRYGDIVIQSGLDTETFETTNAIALLQHSHREPIGQWEDIKKIGGKSKRTEGTVRLVPEGELEEADRAARLIELGIFRTCSIGFVPKTMEWIYDEAGNNTYGIRFIESELIECSVVAVPANRQALIKAASDDKQFVVGFIEDVLDNWQKTPNGMIVQRAAWEDVYKTVTEKSTHEVRALEESAINAPEDTRGELGKNHAKSEERMFERLARAIEDLSNRLLGENKAQTLNREVEPAIEAVQDDPVEVEVMPLSVPGSAALARASATALESRLRANGLLDA